MKNLCILLLFLINLLALFSCKSIVAKAPLAVASTVPEIIQQPSQINVPIKIDLTPYLKEAEKSIPMNFKGQESQCEGVSFSYDFDRKPIQFNGQDSHLFYTINGHYALKINYCPKCTELFDEKGSCISPRVYVSCGVNEEKRKLSITYSSQIRLDQDYRLASTTKLEAVKAIDPCEISVFQYDATGQLEKEMAKSLKKMEKDIDHQIHQIDLKPEMKKLWKSMSAPIPIQNYGFLYIQPRYIGIDDIQINNNTAVTNLYLDFTPEFYTNKQTIKTTPLPPLKAISDSNSGFNIKLDIHSSYDSLSSIITQQIGGKKINIKQKLVIIDSIKIDNPNSNKLIFKVHFSGHKKGIFYLVGTPFFDSSSQLLKFENIDFDIESKSLLLKSAKWILDDKIKEEISKNCSVNLSDNLSSIKKLINQQIQSYKIDDILLKGKIDDIRVINIYPEQKQITIRVSAFGKIFVEM